MKFCIGYAFTKISANTCAIYWIICYYWGFGFFYPFVTNYPGIKKLDNFIRMFFFYPIIKIIIGFCDSWATWEYFKIMEL